MLTIASERKDKKEAERERRYGHTVRKVEEKLKEKSIRESKARACVADLTACSTERNVVGIFLTSSPKNLENPPRYIKYFLFVPRAV